MPCPNRFLSLSQSFWVRRSEATSINFYKASRWWAILWIIYLYRTMSRSDHSRSQFIFNVVFYRDPKCRTWIHLAQVIYLSHHVLFPPPFESFFFQILKKIHIKTFLTQTNWRKGHLNLVKGGSWNATLMLFILWKGYLEITYRFLNWMKCNE